MDEPPTAPVPPFGPPELPPDAYGSLADSEWTPTVPLPDAPIVLPSAPPSGVFAIAVDRIRRLWRTVENQARTLGWAVAVAVPLGLAVSVLIGVVPYVSGDRSFWDAQLRFLLGYWYIVVTVIASIVPVVFTAMRDGRDRALGLILDRRYWRVLVAACVVFPALVATIVFIASHLLAVVLTIAAVVVLLLVLIIFGGGF